MTIVTMTIRPLGRLVLALLAVLCAFAHPAAARQAPAPAPRAARPAPIVEPTAADELAIPRISIEELKKLADDVIVIDVRGADSYKRGHIPGALSIPLSTLEADPRLVDLKAAKKPIVTYCS